MDPDYLKLINQGYCFFSATSFIQKMKSIDVCG